MNEETKIQCPACTAELTPETVECPWCGYLIPQRKEESLVDVILGSQAEASEPEPVTVPSEPPQPQEEFNEPEPTSQTIEPSQEFVPEATVFPVAEPGLTELPSEIRRAPASTLKVMGVVLTIFSFLALAFFIIQVIKGTLPQSVLLLPIFGMMIGLISVAVAQRR